MEETSNRNNNSSSSNNSNRNNNSNSNDNRNSNGNSSNSINIISFTKKGEALAKRIGAYLEPAEQIQYQNKCRTSENYSSKRLSECAKESFEQKQGMIFVGAAGIAVRTIAPFLKDKLHDPFVIVIDENGDYVIPILSGHVGRANEYARKLATFLGAQAVITTATDVSHCFAADLFAQKNQYAIQNKDGIARVSSKTLAHEVITVRTLDELITLSFDGSVVKRQLLRENQEASDIIISPFIEDSKKGVLWLVPRCIVVGVGCRRGKETDAIEQTIQERLAACGIAKEAVCQIASIDRKKDEVGLIETAADFHVEFVTFTEETLKQVPGTFSSSAFVEKTVGVDNVCERSAMAAAPQGTLLAGKYAKDGVTVAIAMCAFSPSF